jgi:hypothetical protein
MPDEVPRSLVDVRTAVRLALGVGGALTVLEGMMVCAPRELWLPFVTIVPPIVTWFSVGSAAARGENARAALRMLVGLLVHVVVCAMVAAGMNALSAEVLGIVVIAVAMLAGLTGAAALPVLLGGSLLASKRDLEAGDVMLGVAGGWLALLQASAIASLSSANERAPSAFLVMLFGLVLGIGALGVSLARGIDRRRWCARVVRGEVEGWRVRVVTSADELATLPAVYGSATRVSAVVERVELANLLYRSGLVGRPVAALDLRP